MLMGRALETLLCFKFLDNVTDMCIKLPLSCVIHGDNLKDRIESVAEGKHLRVEFSSGVNHLGGFILSATENNHDLPVLISSDDAQLIVVVRWVSGSGLILTISHFSFDHFKE